MNPIMDTLPETNANIHGAHFIGENTVSRGRKQEEIFKLINASTNMVCGTSERMD